MGWNRGQHPEKQKRGIGQIAYERQVKSARRLLAPESQDVFRVISERLETEVKSTARLFDIKGLGVTILGSARFSKEHKLEAPPTREILSTIPGATDTITARIGELGIFGTGIKHKLGFNIESDEINDEVAAIEQAYQDIGLPLRTTRYNPNGGITPHCSVALLFEDNVSHYANKDTALYIGRRVLRGITEAEIVFQPLL